MIELNDQMNLNYQFTLQYEKIAFIKDYALARIKQDENRQEDLSDLVKEAREAWELITD